MKLSLIPKARMLAEHSLSRPIPLALAAASLAA